MIKLLSVVLLVVVLCVPCADKFGGDYIVAEQQYDSYEPGDYVPSCIIQTHSGNE